MKKMIAMLLVAVMSLSLVACNGDKETDDKNNEGTSAVVSEVIDEEIVENFNVISQDEFASYLKEEEITVDNWTDFFSINEYGELGLFKTCWISKDFMVEIDCADNGTAEFNAETISKHSFTSEVKMEDLTCLQAQGKIIVADVPDELWKTATDLNTTKWFAFEESESGSQIIVRNELNLEPDYSIISSLIKG